MESLALIVLVTSFTVLISLIVLRWDKLARSGTVNLTIHHLHLPFPSSKSEDDEMIAEVRRTALVQNEPINPLTADQQQQLTQVLHLLPGIIRQVQTPIKEAKTKESEHLVGVLDSLRDTE